MIVVHVTSAAMSYFFELPAPLFGLRAVFAVFGDCIVQFVFCAVDVSVAFVFCARGQRRTNQANDCQQRNTKKSDNAGHPSFSSILMVEQNTPTQAPNQFCAGMRNFRCGGYGSCCIAVFAGRSSSLVRWR
jgi:hypothetical protein